MVATAEFVVRIANLETGATQQRRVAPNPALDPTFAAFTVGSGPECDLVLADPQIAAKHATIVRLGHHTTVTPEPGAITSFRGTVLVPGQARRVDDEPFTVGGFELAVDYV
jgi:hypothetical protein